MKKKLLKFYAEKIVIAFNFVKRINHYMYYHDVGQPNHLFSKTVHLVIGNGNEEENIRSTQFWTTSLWPIVMKKSKCYFQNTCKDT